MPHVRHIGTTRLELVEGDITTFDVDAIANAANEGLRGGGGVDGAIHHAGGSSIMEACRRIGHCPTGEAVLTPGGNLPARHVIHTVGPVWRGGVNGEADALAACYRNSLTLAHAHGLRTIAFPSISTGVYGYPLDKAASVALTSIRDTLASMPGAFDTVTMVLFSRDALEAYAAALAELFPA